MNLYNSVIARASYHLGHRKSSKINSDWLGQLNSAPLHHEENFDRLSQHDEPMTMQLVTFLQIQTAKDCVSPLPNRVPETQNSSTMVKAYLPQHELDAKEDHLYLKPAIAPFAGRLGGNQDFIVDRNDPKNLEVLEQVPDAAPCMTLAEIFDLRGFASPDLWKFAMLECVGKLLTELNLPSPWALEGRIGCLTVTTNSNILSIYS